MLQKWFYANTAISIESNPRVPKGLGMPEGLRLIFYSLRLKIGGVLLNVDPIASFVSSFPWIPTCDGTRTKVV